MDSKGIRVGHLHLATIIHLLLDLPNDDHGEPETGYRIVNAIIQCMREALQRGEEIHIKGFGKFKVVQWAPRRTSHNFIALGVIAPVPMEHRAKKHVMFYPSEQLLAMINKGTTYDEKRAMSIWDKD